MLALLQAVAEAMEEIGVALEEDGRGGLSGNGRARPDSYWGGAAGEVIAGCGVLRDVMPPAEGLIARRARERAHANYRPREGVMPVPIWFLLIPLGVLGLLTLLVLLLGLWKGGRDGKGCCESGRRGVDGRAVRRRLGRGPARPDDRRLLRRGEGSRERAALRRPHRCHRRVPPHLVVPGGTGGHRVPGLLRAVQATGCGRRTVGRAPPRQEVGVRHQAHPQGRGRRAAGKSRDGE
jgi:hypothetical protein